MNLSKRTFLVAAVASSLLVGAFSAPAAAATTGSTVTVKPLSGSWQFGDGNPADTVTLVAPATNCPAGSQYYLNALTKEGDEANVISAGTALAAPVALGADLSIPVQTGAFNNGNTQFLVGGILPAGTSDAALSAADAAKPVGTVIATAPFSIVGACVDANFAVVSSYVTPIDISAATRAPKAADWPVDTFYDVLQWRWDGRADAAAGFFAFPTTVKVNKPLIALIQVTADGSTPTGTVQIKDGSTVVATATLFHGVAAAIVPGLNPAGNHRLTAVYSGDSHVRPGTSSPVTIRVLA
ncbi:Ig-like domain-containing protein [Dactylosporangium sp. NPDC000555]|uniref:Ig-like domain-containing protein n=1 Tax=Dactylosporangium sp. NPDC000555 TaxID=3154260 RepID=UPI00332ECA15